jgi:hypothetical protein
MAFCLGLNAFICGGSKSGEGDIYLAMPENFVFPQLEEEEVEVCQQNGTEPSFSKFVRAALKEIYPGCWMGRHRDLLFLEHIHLKSVEPWTK